ncbi:MAG: histone deacetylase [Nitrospirota bacterium]|nr:MAG: histone deacetylase [Nitrospirota bacterium]
MGRVGFLFHPAFLDHEMGAGHPESPDRLRAIQSHLQSTKTLDQLVLLEPQMASKDWIAEVHTRSYIDSLESRAPLSGYTSLDPDTTMSPGTLRAAYLAAGGAIKAVDAIMNQQVDQAFCALRPPGHHAETNRAMGFCFFNNIAIAARYAQKHHGLRRVLIVDWDVHHGNGTQHTFDEDPTVLFFSTHQYPHYPGTGHSSEIGRGDGKGLTINIPMSGGEGDEEYCEVFQNELVPAAEAFKPELVLISAGFDAHRDDPLASMNLTEEGYGSLTRMVTEIAKRHASGRVISCLEGGYHLQGLAASVNRHIVGLLEA